MKGRPTSRRTTLTSRRRLIAISLRRARPGTGSDLSRAVREPRAGYAIPDPRRIFLRTRFVVVGGVATARFMPVRMTLDLDVLVAAEDLARAEEELRRAGAVRGGILTIGGSHWRLADGTALDLIGLERPWTLRAIARPVWNESGWPVADLPWLVLMKLESGRLQDTADVSRMLGAADAAARRRVRTAVRRYRAGDAEDLESLIALGRLEYAETRRPRDRRRSGRA